LGHPRALRGPAKRDAITIFGRPGDGAHFDNRFIMM
jgi:hypothetical protein